MDVPEEENESWVPIPRYIDQTTLLGSQCMTRMSNNIAPTSTPRLSPLTRTLQPNQTHIINRIAPTRRIAAERNRQLVYSRFPALAARKRIAPRLVRKRLVIPIRRANMHQFPYTGDGVGNTARHARLAAGDSDSGGVGEVVFDAITERGDVLLA